MNLLLIKSTVFNNIRPKVTIPHFLGFFKNIDLVPNNQIYVKFFKYSCFKILMKVKSHKVWNKKPKYCLIFFWNLHEYENEK